MSIFGRSIVRDYEAQLHPVDAGPDAPRCGKVEWELFEDGEVEFELRVRGLALPDGTALSVHVGGRAVGELVLQRGRGTLKLVAPFPGAVPEPAVGDVVELRAARDGAERAVVRGVLAPD